MSQGRCSGKKNTWRNPITNEPSHNTSFETAYAPNEDSDRPAQRHRLIRVFDLCLKTCWILSYPKRPCEHSDPTVRMRRLIRVFAGRICAPVGTAVARRNC